MEIKSLTIRSVPSHRLESKESKKIQNETETKSNCEKKRIERDANASLEKRPIDSC